MASNVRIESSGSYAETHNFNHPSSLTRVQGGFTTGGSKIHPLSNALDRANSHLSLEGIRTLHSTGDPSPLSRVFLLDELSTGNNRWSRTVDLDKAISVAVAGEQHGFEGSVPRSFSRDEQKGILAQLRSCREGARARMTKMNEALAKLERYIESNHSRRRLRAEMSLPSSLPLSLHSFDNASQSSGRGTSKLASKASPHGQSSSSSGDGIGVPKKMKAGLSSKRVRTVGSELREGSFHRPTVQLNHQKSLSSGSFLDSKTSPKLSPNPSSPMASIFSQNEGNGDFKKMKGKRSRPKPDANGAHSLQRTASKAEGVER